MSVNESNGKYKEGKSEAEEAIALTTADKNIWNSAHDNTGTEVEDEFHDGCIVLGQDADKGIRYCTRFHIDRTKQRDFLSVKEVIVKTCCPCFLLGKSLSCVSRVWQLFRSQAFLLALHFTVVVLGVLKECLDLRRVAEEAHLWHSVVETFVTVLIIIIRHVSAWHAFKQLKVERHKVEYVDPKLGIKTRSRAIKKLFKCYAVVSVIMTIFAVVCFILFYTHAHLGWTILSNNFALVLIMACDALLRGRMSAEANLVREDHSKAVTYEMSLLLNEAVNAPEGPVREKVNNRVKKFQKAFRDTTMFNQPEYISISDGYKDQDQMNMLTTLEVVSM